jgi:hypothetical protein
MSATADGLPHVDEHSAVIEAGADAAWDALLRVAEGTVSAGAAPHLARALGCADVAAAGPRPLAEGSVVPGFHVAEADAPRELALVGSHRFSNYALLFHLDDLGSGRTRVRAETRAEFPGFKGSAYRAMVIGTRMHVLVTRRMLGGVKRLAERA